MAESEVLRVLCPGGVLLVRQRGDWTRTVKPRSDKLGEWTHSLHGPDNNAATADDDVGPPQHIQWISGPRFLRSHDHLASVSVMVASGGRRTAPRRLQRSLAGPSLLLNSAPQA